MENAQRRLNAYRENVANESNLPTPCPSIKIYHHLFNYNVVDPAKAIHECIVEVVPNDTLDTVYDHKSRGLNPLLLNMADDCFPGGCWTMGAGAQEESIFYRSNYFKTLNLQSVKYPINDDVCVYSKNVTVFRDGDLNVCKTWNVDIVAVAAIKRPRLVDGRLGVYDKELMKKKIELIFLLGIANGHNSLVLSALGCGAFKNPPEDIVEIFNEMLQKYKRFFKVITFAIIPNTAMKGRYITNEQNGNKCNFVYFNKHIESCSETDVKKSMHGQ